MSAEDEQQNVMQRVQQRRVELMGNESSDTINIGEARRQVTALESLFPRVSVESTEEENGSIVAYIVNVRSIDIGPLQGLTNELAKLKARGFIKLKMPSKSISGVSRLSSKNITLPLIETPTGRTFNTFRVEIE